MVYEKVEIMPKIEYQGGFFELQGGIQHRFKTGSVRIAGGGMLKTGTL